MLLRNVSLVGEESPKDILIKDGMIKSVISSNTHSNFSKEEHSIHFSEALAFPGLINSHDHLDFNLFPPLKNKTYNNYREWGEDIHKKNRAEIDQTTKVPLHLRIEWGIYKNLLNGFTTVVNHGKHLNVGNDIVNVFQNTRSLHSVGFEKNWRWKLNNPFKKNRPIAIHVGEGKDETSHQEISRLTKWNLRQKKLIGVHGVAMDTDQAAKFRALVWCPASNYFLLDKTAEVHSLKDKTDIIFGSDSTLTSCWNIWEHIRLANDEKKLSEKELLDSMTAKPAEVWNLPDVGKIENALQADIVIAKKKENKNAYDAFFSLNPQDILMILHKGNIRLFDHEIADEIARHFPSLTSFSKIKINGSIKHVQGNISSLITEIKKHRPAIELPISVL